MFKKLIKNEGSSSLTFVVMMPLMMLIMFMMIDVASFAIQKKNLQRRLDAAALGIAIQARPTNGTYITEDGFIVDPDTMEVTDHIACEVTDEMVAEAEDRIQQATKVDIDSYQVKYISTQAEKEDGVVRLSVEAEYNDLITKVFKMNIKIPYQVQSYAVCTYSPMD